MADTTIDHKSTIKSLLIDALPDENLNDYNIEIVGTTSKGDGFSGRIYFVNLISQHKTYNLALKCSESSETLRKIFPVQLFYDNEIFMYNTVFPAFRKFEIQRHLDDVFDSVPNYYGYSVGQGQEMIALENLKIVDYGLWDKKRPLPRHYLEAVLKQYGKWHAISAAMQDQEPENFVQLTKNFPDLWSVCLKVMDFEKVCRSGFETAEEILKNDLDEDILKEWGKLKDQLTITLPNARKKSKTFNVIIHGDCWNNNFLFQVNDNKNIKVAMLDWQLSGLASPVFDVSYFFYTCVSGEDLKDLDDLLQMYYTSFAEHLRKLGSDPDQIYTYTNLLNDWKIYARLGLIYSTILIRTVCMSDEDLPDFAQVAEKNGDLDGAFCKTVKYVDLYKQRLGSIIEHGVKRGFIQPVEDF